MAGKRVSSDTALGELALSDRFIYRFRGYGGPWVLSPRETGAIAARKCRSEVQHCRYRTTMETFPVDRQFLNMLELADFGHRIGEVDFRRNKPHHRYQISTPSCRKYSRYFATGDAISKGKVGAYFAVWVYF